MSVRHNLSPVVGQFASVERATAAALLRGAGPYNGRRSSDWRGRVNARRQSRRLGHRRSIKRLITVRRRRTCMRQNNGLGQSVNRCVENAQVDAMIHGPITAVYRVGSFYWKSLGVQFSILKGGRFRDLEANL